MKEMAKPIERTPTLRGKDAERFLLKMLETQNRPINEIEKEFVRLISRGRKQVQSNAKITA